jgi:hypothetical protein
MPRMDFPFRIQAWGEVDTGSSAGSRNAKGGRFGIAAIRVGAQRRLSPGTDFRRICHGGIVMVSRRHCKMLN